MTATLGKRRRHYAAQGWRWRVTFVGAPYGPFERGEALDVAPARFAPLDVSAELALPIAREGAIDECAQILEGGALPHDV